MDYANIPIGYRVQTQIPLNIKQYVASEADLQNLGTSSNLAFTYEQGIIIYAIEEGTRWEWKEVTLENDGEGLLTSNFTYPDGVVTFGIDYSNRVFNFFEYKAELPPLELIDEGNGNGIIIRGRFEDNYGSIGEGAVDLSTSFSPSSTNGATGERSFAANTGNEASGQDSAVFGNGNISSGSVSFTAGRDNIASQTASIALGNNNQSTNDNTIALGNSTIASGLYSFSGGTSVYARSFGEIALGTYSTDYSALGVIGFNALDRIFNIGNGSNGFFRSDALTILKNGLATLPSVTNALITAASNKAIITREYLESIDSNALHKSFNESFVGIKSSTNTGAALTNGISLINNGTGDSSSLIITSGSTGIGEYVFNNGSGTGIKINNTSTGNALILNTTTSGSGLNIIGQDNGSTTFSVSKIGDVTANKFIKTGGTASQYLMADGSVTISTGTIQSIIITGGWSTNQGFVVDTTIGTGKTIISITSTLICTVTNNGYAVGDIVSVSPTQPNDSGGLADSGVSVRYRADTSDRFTFNVNDRIDIPNCYNGSVGTSGAITDPVSASSGQWNMRHVILYI